MNLESVVWSDCQAKILVLIHLEKEMKAIFSGVFTNGMDVPHRLQLLDNQSLTRISGPPRNRTCKVTVLPSLEKFSEYLE